MSRNILLSGAAMAAALVAGCVHYEPPAPNPEAPTTSDVAAPLDAVWGRLTGSLLDLGMQIETVDRDAGLLLTDWWRVADTNRADAIMTCGRLWGQQVRPDYTQTAWVRLQVVVAEREPELVQVRLAPRFKLVENGSTPEESNYDWDDCASTGLLERQLLETLETPES